MKVLFVWPNKESFNYKPITIPLLSAIAYKSGWERRLYDTTEIDFGVGDCLNAGERVKNYKAFDHEKYGLVKRKIDLRLSVEKILGEYKPDLMAVSALSSELLIAVQICKIAKSVTPELPIIWGGKYATLNPEKTLKLFGADFVCVGEGLEAFPEFLNAFANGQDLHNIANIWARSSDKIVSNKMRPLKKDLDDLPYLDWDIFDKRFFYKPFDGNVYIGGDHMLNWGCPYHCSYCINHFYHGIYNNNYFMRRYTPRRIIDELKFLKHKYGIEFYKFHDEDFLMRPLESLRELSFLYKREVNLPFGIETNPKSITNEKIRLLKEMNCVSVGAAIETGNINLRKNLLKRADSEDDVINAFRILNEAGILNSSFSMFGIPFETRQTYEETVELNRKANAQYTKIGFFYPFEGTQLREISIKEGFFNPENEEGRFMDLYKPYLRFNYLSEEELMQMYNVFALYVKLPKYYWPYIRRSEKYDDLGKKIRKKILDIFDKTVWNNNGWFVDDRLKDKHIAELNEILEGHK